MPLHSCPNPQNVQGKRDPEGKLGPPSCPSAGTGTTTCIHCDESSQGSDECGEQFAGECGFWVISSLPGESHVESGDIAAPYICLVVPSCGYRLQSPLAMCLMSIGQWNMSRQNMCYVQADAFKSGCLTSPI